jgi:hypothetical protein
MIGGFSRRAQLREVSFIMNVLLKQRFFLRFFLSDAAIGSPFSSE